MSISRGQIAQGKVQLSANVVEQVTQVRQAWVRAVAARQSLDYADQIKRTAAASAELARRMQQVGNFNKLQRARQQVFYADSAAQLAASQHAATAAREELTRQLGLTDAQAAQLKLPERLPTCPKQRARRLRSRPMPPNSAWTFNWPATSWTWPENRKT